MRTDEAAKEHQVTALLTDVAKRAGVSLATASRAFGEPDRLAASTRRRVLEAAAELGYVTTTSVSERTFGVLVPDVSSAVFATLLKSIQGQAWHGRHRMMLSDTNEELPRERELLAQARQLDGVILCSPRLDPAEILELTGGTPVVVINREVEGATSVLMEADAGIRQAVENLAALGHSRLAYVPGPVASWANGRRLAAIQNACEAHDIKVSVVGNQSATVHGGVAAAASVASSAATAVIAYNDLVALGLMSGLAEFGLHCPTDVSVVGIDDLDISAASEPSLTTVRMALERSGSLALELLLDRIAGRPTPDHAVHLESQLIVRGSTGRAPTPARSS